MSWSNDFIWITAIRKDLEEDFVVLPESAPCALNGMSIAADPPNDKRTMTYRDIFIVCKPPRKTCPIVVIELSTQSLLNTTDACVPTRRPKNCSLLRRRIRFVACVFRR